MSKCAVVTGAASGIGAAATQRLQADGWKVIGLDSSFEGLSSDDRHANVRDRESIRIALEDVPRIDAVVSCAAVMPQSNLAEMSLADWDSTLDTNLTAMFHLIALTRDRLATNGGSLIAISSVHAHSTTEGAGAYAASKAGLEALVRAAAIELAPDGIRVNAVAPGATRTPMLPQEGDEFDRLLERTPLGRIAEPSEIADAIRFLIASSGGFITGQTLVVDGGVTSRLSSE